MDERVRGEGGGGVEQYEAASALAAHFILEIFVQHVERVYVSSSRS